jgi:hypothetical protein
MKSEIAPFLSAIALLYLGLTGLSHFAYNIQDDAGLVCRERDPKALAPGESKEVSFMLSDMCNNTGILLEEGVKYSSKIVATTPWKDEERDSDADGFYSSEAPTVWKRMKYILAVPLRREAIRPWFRVVARYGSAGGEEVFFDPDPITKSIDATVRATRSGELFIFLNDAVLRVPGMYDAFYRNNKREGSATVRKL